MAFSLRTSSVGATATPWLVFEAPPSGSPAPPSSAWPRLRGAHLADLPFEHILYGRANPAVVEICERLKAMAPVRTGRIFLACSESEANDTAVNLALAWHAARGEPGRCLILAQDRAYYGSTVFATGLTGLPTLHKAFGLL